MNDVHFSLYITYTRPYYTYEAIPKVRTCRHQQHLRLYGQGNQGHTSSFQENTLRFLRQLDGIWIPQPHAPPLIFFSMKINVLCFRSFLLLCNKKKQWGEVSSSDGRSNNICFFLKALTWWSSLAHSLVLVFAYTPKLRRMLWRRGVILLDWAVDPQSQPARFRFPFADG